MNRIARVLRWFAELIERPTVIESPYAVQVGWLIIRPAGYAFEIVADGVPKAVRMSPQQLFWFLQSTFELMDRIEEVTEGNK
jgi:hypothetical protein